MTIIILEYAHLYEANPLTSRLFHSYRTGTVRLRGTRGYNFLENSHGKLVKTWKIKKSHKKCLKDIKTMTLYLNLTEIAQIMILSQ